MGPLALLLITLLLSCTYSRDCNNHYECQLQNISDTISVVCNGYFSCFQTPSIASTSAPVHCLGSHSCYKATTITAQSNIYCRGLYSCAFVQNMNSNSKVNVYANGGYSMYGIMNANTAISGSLYLYGYLACYDCAHNVDGDIYASGALALQNSFISITRSEATTINLYSYLTLYNGEFHCGWGTECTMKCLGGNSCENMRFTCPAVGAICSVDCQYSTKNELCPNGLYADWLDDIKYENLFENESNLNKYNWTFSTYENSHQICNTTNAINCDDYQDTMCYQQHIINLNGPICCTGSEACGQISSNNNYIYVNDPNINSIDDVAIRCDSHYACKYGNIKTEHGGNIYCSGNGGCIYSKINATENTNIFCEGSDSCRKSSIYDAKNLLCTGNYACYESNIYNLAGNIYGLAQYALRSTLIHNIAGNIYCLAYQGAYGTIIDGANNIYGNSLACFYKSQISNVNNLYLIGEYILASSTVTNVESIYVSGKYSISSSKIENFRNIEIYGDTSLFNSILISGNYIHTQNNYQTEVNISIYDNYNSVLPSQIYCNSSDTCNILCLSSYACQRLHLYCDGQCYVYCDESNGILCPLSGNYITVTKMPTYTPSKYPTTSPSQSPTSFTLLPSNIPTKSPTNLPTQSPTYLPSVSPSKIPTTPTDIVTSKPIRSPTRLPTFEPTLIPIKVPSDIPSENPSYSLLKIDNESGSTTIIVISVIAAILCLIFGICVLIYFFKIHQFSDKKNENDIDFHGEKDDANDVAKQIEISSLLTIPKMIGITNIEKEEKLDNGNEDLGNDKQIRVTKMGIWINDTDPDAENTIILTDGMKTNQFGTQADETKIDDSSQDNQIEGICIDYNDVKDTDDSQ